MNVIKYLPNIISGIRLILSICLLLPEPFKEIFWCIYFLCGLSDMLDGYLARKFKVTSKAGALLDSLGDTAFTLIMLSRILWQVFFPVWVVCWIVVIAVLKGLSILVGYIRFSTFAALHTYANKVTGFVLFLGLPIYIIWGSVGMMIFILAVATWAAVEEFLIITRSKSLDRDRKGILFRESNE